MNINAFKSKERRKVNFKTPVILFLLAVICAALADRVYELSGTAVIICTCFPLLGDYGKPLLKNVADGVVIGTAAALICAVIGAVTGNISVGYLLYSLFCGILLLCPFAYLLKFMPENHAKRTVSLLFMYIALAGAAA